MSLVYCILDINEDSVTLVSMSRDAVRKVSEDKCVVVFEVVKETGGEDEGSLDTT